MPAGFLSQWVRGRGAASAQAPDCRWRSDPSWPQAPVVSFTVDGRQVSAPQGQALAVALAFVGQLQLRLSPTAGTPRGMFCLMGSCQECLVHVDGEPRLACLEPVRAGMRVELDLLHRAGGGEQA
jgi:hypothetical protein